MAEALVRGEGLGRTYGDGPTAVVALREATFEAARGDRIAVVGPSGSGKTTLLHLMAALDVPTEGRIEWPALGPREALRPSLVGVAFQGPSLLPPLTVTENVALPILLAGGPEEEAVRAARSLLDRFELADVADKLPEEISGGQSQRAAIARALIGSPLLVLADEPTGQQDSEGARRLLEEMLARIAEMGAALVLATHDPAVAQRMASQWSISGGVLDAGVSSRSP